MADISGKLISFLLIRRCESFIFEDSVCKKEEFINSKILLKLYNKLSSKEKDKVSTLIKNMKKEEIRYCIVLNI